MSGVGEGSLAQTQSTLLRQSKSTRGQPETGLHPRGHWTMTEPALRSSETDV